MVKNKVSKTKQSKLTPLGKDVMRGLKQAIAFKKGRPVKVVTHIFPVIPKQVDVKSIRDKLHMTQEEFTQFGFTIGAIRHWEAHRRTPAGPARILLKLIEKSPDIVRSILKDNHLPR
jgi:putative transcriptional regulator